MKKNSVLRVAFSAANGRQTWFGCTSPNFRSQILRPQSDLEQCDELRRDAPLVLRSGKAKACGLAVQQAA